MVANSCAQCLSLGREVKVSSSLSAQEAPKGAALFAPGAEAETPAKGGALPCALVTFELAAISTGEHPSAGEEKLGWGLPCPAVPPACLEDRTARPQIRARLPGHKLSGFALGRCTCGGGYWPLSLWDRNSSGRSR